MENSASTPKSNSKASSKCLERNDIDTSMFQEALNHNAYGNERRKIMKEMAIYLKTHLEDFYAETFNEIYTKVYDHCIKIKGIGKLSCYDFTNAICKYYGVPINIVFIIKKRGPYNAAIALGLENQIKTETIRKNLKFQYLEIDVAIQGLRNQRLKINSDITDGDIIESCMCKWHHHHKKIEELVKEVNNLNIICS